MLIAPLDFVPLAITNRLAFIMRHAFFNGDAGEGAYPVSRRLCVPTREAEVHTIPPALKYPVAVKENLVSVGERVPNLAALTPVKRFGDLFSNFTHDLCSSKSEE